MFFSKHRTLVPWMVLICLALTPSAWAQKGNDKKAIRRTASDALFAHGKIPTLKIILEKEELRTLQSKNRDYVACTVVETMSGEEPREYAGVGIHLKGDGGSFRPLHERPALTLNFDYFVEGLHFHGLDKLHLNNSVQDPTYLHEALGAYVFSEAGVPAPRVTHARVYLNDRDLGLYVLKESFDKVFLARHFKDSSGVLYEGKVKDIDNKLPHKPDELKNPPSLKPLLDAAREDDASLRRQKLSELMDVESFITFMACENLLAHWDGYAPHRNNYRLYLHPKTNQFTFLPQGLDQLLQRPDYGIVQGGAIVSGALTRAPEDRAKLVERVKELREKLFDPEKLSAKVDEISGRLKPALQEISADAWRNHQNHASDLKRRIVERARHVDRQLGVPPVKFDASGALAVEKGWEPQIQGAGLKAERVELEGRKLLHLKAESGGVVSWRLPLELPQGKYTFEARVKTSAVEAPDGENSGVGLRISGGKRGEKLTGDSDWQTASFPFEVTENLRTVVLVCELRAKKGEAWFDSSTLKIRRQ